MRQKTFKKMLECKLTTEEHLKKSMELSKTLDSIDAAEDKLEMAKSQIKSDITSLEATKNKLKKIVSSGVEFREVECDIVYDWDANTKSIIRPDTGEVVDVDIIPEADLQEHLSFLEEENREINAQHGNGDSTTSDSSVQAEEQAEAVS